MRKLYILPILTLFLFVYSAKAQTNILAEGFEDAFPPTGWTVLNLGDTITGETWKQSSDTPYAGTYKAFSQDGESGYAMEEWLITSAIAVPASHYIEITFWEKTTWGFANDGPEYVMISTTGTAPENFTDTVYTNPDDTPSAWTQVLLNDLPDYAGETVYIAFVHTSANGYADAWNLDDISVDAFETGSTDVGMLSVEIPGQYCFVEAEVFPTFTIKNFGTADITESFQLNCEIRDSLGVLAYSALSSYSEGLSIGETDQVSFAGAWTPDEIGIYSVKIWTVLTGDENNGNDTINTETEVVQHYGTGGPDAFGYQWIDSEVDGGPEYDWIEISTTGESAIMYGGMPTFYGDDNFSEPIDFGFDFPFYGINRTSFHVDVNGEIYLGENNWYNSYPNVGWGTDGNMINHYEQLPGNSYAPALVAVYWDDLIADESTGDVYFQTFGAEPDRYCVVQWNNLRFLGGTVEDTSLTFEVIFYENGEMKFQYKDVAIGQTGSVYPHDNGQSCTIGIQNDTYDIGLSYLFELLDDEFNYLGVDPVGNLLNDSLAIKFYCTNQPPVFSYDISGNTFDNTPEFEISISDMTGIRYDSLYYNTGSGWQAVTHSSFEEPNMYYYELPGIPNSTVVDYYFAADDNSGENLRGTLPENAPAEYYSIQILPTSNDVKVLLAYSGSQDYDNKEFDKYTAVFDSKSIVYDIYDWEEYDEFSFTDNYDIIFMYGRSMGHGDEEDTLGLALMDFLDTGTNEYPKNIFTASDDLPNAVHGLPNNSSINKFASAYIRTGYIPQENPPYYGGTDGIGGPDIYDYSDGSIIGMGGSPIGTEDLEIPVYSNSPDVIYNRACPSWYEDEVTNPEISSWGSFLFEDGPHSGDAFSKGNGCGIWLDNLIYKSFFLSFDISQLTSDADINTMIQEALDWFGYNVNIDRTENNVENINIFPNPCNGTFNLKLSNYDIHNVLIELINIHGQVIFEQTITNLNHENKINVSGLKKGLYFIRINTDNGIKIKKLVIK